MSPHRLISTPSRTRTTLFVASALIIVSFIMATASIWDRFQQTDSRRAFQAKINAQLLAQDRELKAQNGRQEQTLVDLLCFVGSFNGARQPTPAQREASKRFIEGALKSIHASPLACIKRPGN